MQDPERYTPFYRRPFVGTLLHTLGFIFLILGVPIILFLPTAFRMPTWWEPSLDLLLNGLLFLCSLLMTGLITCFAILQGYVWWRTRPRIGLRLVGSALMLLGITLVMWMMLMETARHFFSHFF